MKKRVLLLAAVMALIAGASFAYAAGSGGGLPGGEPAVWGGGHLNVAGIDRDFSIVATPDGGEWMYGLTGPGGLYVDADVSCLNVTGNHAVVGGTIRRADYYPQLVGRWFLWYVIDNGKLATTGTSDQTSVVAWFDDSDIANRFGGITKAFPYVCPPFSAKPDVVSMFDVTGGDIVVQKATQNQNQQ